VIICLRRLPTAVLWIFCWAAVLAPAASFAQQEESPARKVVSRVVPDYPPMARSLNLRGSVRVDAMVSPNGTVKAVQVKGGHPVLAQAAESAIRRWRWQAANHESLETIEFKFDPH
jgi:periplasmic protein TonB